MNPSGEKANDDMARVCPSNVCSNCPVWTSHSLTVLSFPPLATLRASGENAIELIPSLCPLVICFVPTLCATSEAALQAAVKRANTISKAVAHEGIWHVFLISVSRWFGFF
jgi:hypothetical protein